MDGTLLNSQKQLSEGILEYIHQQSQKGILFCVASGRQYYSLKEIFEKIHEDIIYVAENGMFILYRDQELFSHTLDKNKVKEFVDIARSIPDTYAVVCGKKSAYYEVENEKFHTEASRYYARLQYVNSLDDVLQSNDEIIKVAIWSDRGTEHHVYPHFQQIKDYLVSVSAFDWMDIMPLGFNKGTAVRFLQDHFKISKDETLVFGDYLNDLEMMQEATYSYAMKNAHPDLIQVSNYMTEYTNDEDGVFKELIKILGK